jgi:hypothetical protein
MRVQGVCTVHAPMRGGHVHHLHGKVNCAGCRADQADHLAACCPACNLHIGDPAGAARAATDPPNAGVTKW